MASVETLQRLVDPYCKGAPVILVQDKLMQAARDFMLFTRWERESIAIDVVDGTRVYTATPTDATLKTFAVVATAYDGEPLECQIPANVRPGTTGFYFFAPPNVIQLSWIPDEDLSTGLTAECCLVIKEGETTIPDGLVQRWQNYLAFGALAQLQSMANTVWYNPGEAKKHLNLWASGNEQAHYEANNQAKAYSLSNSQGPSG